MSKRVLSVFLTSAVLVGMVSGCGSTGNPSASEGAEQQAAVSSSVVESTEDVKNVTLTIECSQAFNTPSSAVFNTINMEAFQAQYPHIKIDTLLIPDAQTTVTLQTKLASGEPSDLLVYNKVSAENELNLMTNMVDLSNEPWVARMKQPEIVQSPDGKVYGYIGEIKTGGVGIVYNVDIFEGLNLTVPTTYDEFLKLCEDIQAQGITPIFGPYKDAWTFQIFPTTGWGTLVQEKMPDIFDQINSNQTKWSDVPEFLEVLQRADNLIKKGYVQETCLSDDFNGAPAAFSSKKYAMMFMGDWFIKDMYTRDPELKLSMFPIPIFDDPAMNLLDQSQYGGMLCIPKEAKNVEEAKLFIDFISQPEQLENDMIDPAMAFLPNFVDGPDPTLSEIDNKLYNEYVKTGKYSFEANTYVKVDLNDLWKYYQDMIGGVKTPEEVMTNWDGKFAELMKAKDFEGF